MTSLKNNRDYLVAAMTAQIDKCIATHEEHEKTTDKGCCIDAYPTHFKADVTFYFKGNTKEVRSIAEIDLRKKNVVTPGCFNQPARVLSDAEIEQLGNIENMLEQYKIIYPGVPLPEALQDWALRLASADELNAAEAMLLKMTSSEPKIEEAKKPEKGACWKSRITGDLVRIYSACGPDFDVLVTGIEGDAGEAFDYKVFLKEFEFVSDPPEKDQAEEEPAFSGDARALDIAEIENEYGLRLLAFIEAGMRAAIYPEILLSAIQRCLGKNNART